MSACPYHAWTYLPDGSLKTAKLMPGGFRKEDYGLYPCHVDLFEGLIFVNLAEQAPPSLASLYSSYRGFARQQGLARAKVANRKNYPTRANWKLVVENFFECYHCAPPHPEYSSVHSRLKVLARGTGKGSGPAEAEREFAPVFDRWEAEAQKLGHLTGLAIGGNEDTGSVKASRTLINEGFLSETLDGRPACNKLMGAYRDFDGA